MVKKSKKNHYQNTTQGNPRQAYDSLRETYIKAQQLHQQGHLTEAEKLYRQILGQMPDQPDTLHYLGLINMQKGSDKEAESLIKRSIILSNNPMYCGNYGLFLATRNKHNEAIRQYKKALEIHPAYPECWYNLGVSCSSIGDFSASEHAYKKALEYNKNYIKALYNLAGVQEAQGKSEEAAETIKKIKSSTPDTADTYYKLAVILQKIGGSDNIRKARGYFRKALEIEPDSVEILSAFAASLAEGGVLEGAIDVYRHILSIEPEYKDVNLLYGRCLTRTDDIAEAEQIFSKILQQDPENMEAFASLGNINRIRGDFSRAQGIYEKILEADPYNLEAINGLANCRKFTDRNDKFLDMLKNYPEAKRDIRYYYSLGKIFNDLGEHDQAFLSYKEANDRQNRHIEYDHYEHTKYCDAIINTFTTDFVAKLSASGSGSQLPVYIVGTPRSGTTLTEQIISSHSLVHGAGELVYIERLARNKLQQQDNVKEYPERMQEITPDDVKQEAGIYLDKIAHNLDVSIIQRVTDKMPGNFFYIGYIFMLFPNARIIHCKRNPLDTCLSIYFLSMNSRHAYGSNLENLGYWYRDYLRLMEHWNSIFGDRILNVEYNDTVNDTENTAKKMIEFCGLDWEEKCLEFYKSDRHVKTPSQWQVRQPIYKSSLDRWKRYEKHIGVLKEILAGYY